MKKNIVILLVSITSTVFAVEKIKTELDQLKQQNKKITPLHVKAINTVEKAVKTLDHLAFCLITGKKCTPKDRLSVSYALGFAIGASYDIYPIARLLAKHNITDKKWIRASGQLAAEMAFTAANLKGTLLTPLTSAFQHAILSAIFLIGNIKQAVATAMERESVLMFLKELTMYLAKDAQCIWSESYCQVTGFPVEPDINLTPAAKREALYFWMGVLSGVLIKRGIVKTLQTYAGQARAFGGSIYQHGSAALQSVPTKAEQLRQRFKY